MNRIITNGGGPMHRGSDYCTIDQMMNAVLNTYGPVAQLMTEMCDRLNVVEQRLGIEPIESAGPMLDTIREADGGDIEC